VGIISASLKMQDSVVAYNIKETEAVMLRGERTKLKVATDSIATTIGDILSDSASKEEQLEFIRTAVENVRFEDDKSGYFFVYEGTTVVALPIKKSVIGQDLSSVTDSDGVRYVHELSKAAGSGGGFVRYVFDKPGQGLQPKLAYARPISGTQYWIGTGVYIDNIDAERERLETATGDMVSSAVYTLTGSIAAALILLVLPVCALIIVSIVRPIRSATEAAHQIAQGNLDITLDDSGKDEVARLQSSLNSMVRELVATIETVKQKEAEANRQAEAAHQATEQTKEAMARARAIWTPAATK
jgi:methyl-accepting chemotaxis protein